MPDDVDGRVLFQRNRARAQAGLAGEVDPGGERKLGGIVRLPKVLEAWDSGALRATPMFDSLDELTEAGFDELVWCTGFRPAVRPFRELVRTTDSGRLHSAVSGFYLVGLGETTDPVPARSWVCSLSRAKWLGRSPRSWAKGLFRHVRWVRVPLFFPCAVRVP